MGFGRSTVRTRDKALHCPRCKCVYWWFLQRGSGVGLGPLQAIGKYASQNLGWVKTRQMAGFGQQDAGMLRHCCGSAGCFIAMIAPHSLRKSRTFLCEDMALGGSSVAAQLAERLFQLFSAHSKGSSQDARATCVVS